MSRTLIQGDWLEGFSSGKKAALLDWQHRREKRDFAKLVNRLKVRRWRLRIVAAGGAPLEAHRAYKRRWAARRWAAMKAAKKPEERVCAHVACAAPFTIPVERVGRRPIYCSLRCQKAAGYARTAPERSFSCEHCGTAHIVTGAAHVRRFCDRSCRDRARYARLKGAVA